jgi:hypothetical protein
MTDRLLAGATIIIALGLILAVDSGVDWIARSLALAVVTITIVRVVLA